MAQDPRVLLVLRVLPLQAQCDAVSRRLLRHTTLLQAHITLRLHSLTPRVLQVSLRCLRTSSSHQTAFLTLIMALMLPMYLDHLRLHRPGWADQAPAKARACHHMDAWQALLLRFALLWRIAQGRLGTDTKGHINITLTPPRVVALQAVLLPQLLLLQRLKPQHVNAKIVLRLYHQSAFGNGKRVTTPTPSPPTTRSVKS